MTQGFVAAVKESLSASLANEALVHGVRTQALFEALVVSLGQILLIKQEDAGEAYAADQNFQIPVSEWYSQTVTFPR